MAADDLHTLSIRDLGSRLRSGALTAVELTSSLLDRIEKLDGGIRAWVAVSAERALEAARQRDGEPASGRGPLHGIPIGIKDVFDTAGVRTTYGSPLYATHVPAASAEAVERLEAAGAIVLGKLATSEFAALDPAPTRNPRDPRHTPGGSSSGSAAAVAAGMCPAALGTQTAGSIGRPAAFCGVVGCMPTQSRIPRTGVFPAAWSLDHVGAFSRSVDDVAIVIGALAGEDFSAPDPRERIEVGVLGEYFERHAQPEAWKAHEAFVGRLRATPGIGVRALGLPPRFEDSVAALWTIMKAEIAAVHRERYAGHAPKMGQRIGGLIAQGLEIPAVEYLDAIETRRRFQEQMDAVFAAVDIVISPGAPGPAPEGLESTGDPVMNAPWTLADLPTVSVPITDGSGGLPLGVQVSAPRLGESSLFDAARKIEAVRWK